MFSVAIASQKGRIKYQTLMKLGGDNCTAKQEIQACNCVFSVAEW
jgi:hypothetical protein